MKFRKAPNILYFAYFATFLTSIITAGSIPTKIKKDTKYLENDTQINADIINKQNDIDLTIEKEPNLIDKDLCIPADEMIDYVECKHTRGKLQKEVIELKKELTAWRTRFSYLQLRIYGAERTANIDNDPMIDLEEVKLQSLNQNINENIEDSAVSISSLGKEFGNIHDIDSGDPAFSMYESGIDSKIENSNSSKPNANPVKKKKWKWMYIYSEGNLVKIPVLDSAEEATFDVGYDDDFIDGDNIEDSKLEEDKNLQEHQEEKNNNLAVAQNPQKGVSQVKENTHQKSVQTTVKIQPARSNGLSYLEYQNSKKYRAAINNTQVKIAVVPSKKIRLVPRVAPEEKVQLLSVDSDMVTKENSEILNQTQEQVQEKHVIDNKRIKNRVKQNTKPELNIKKPMKLNTLYSNRPARRPIRRDGPTRMIESIKGKTGRCVDNSFICKNIVDFCDRPKYQEMCCKTCQGVVAADYASKRRQPEKVYEEVITLNSDDDIQVRDETPQQRNKDLEINPTFENIEEENKEPATPALSETFGLINENGTHLIITPETKQQMNAKKALTEQSIIQRIDDGDDNKKNILLTEEDEFQEEEYDYNSQPTEEPNTLMEDPEYIIKADATEIIYSIEDAEKDRKEELEHRQRVFEERKIRKEQQEKRNKERMDRENREKEQREKERLEKEERERQRLEQERAEMERQQQEEQERLRIEEERRILREEEDRIEAERLAQQLAESPEVEVEQIKPDLRNDDIEETPNIQLLNQPTVERILPSAEKIDPDDTINLEGVVRYRMTIGGQCSSDNDEICKQSAFFKFCAFEQWRNICCKTCQGRENESIEVFGPGAFLVFDDSGLPAISTGEEQTEYVQVEPIDKIQYIVTSEQEEGKNLSLGDSSIEVRVKLESEDADTTV